MFQGLVVVVLQSTKLPIIIKHIKKHHAKEHAEFLQLNETKRAVQPSNWHWQMLGYDLRRSEPKGTTQTTDDSE